MKKRTKKLVVAKETLRDLSNPSLRKANGGAVSVGTCLPWMEELFRTFFCA
jgi:hypothetical protein